MAGALLQLVLPQRCVVCALPGEVLCASCAAALPRIRPPLCARCGAPTAWPVSRCRECAGRRIAFASARAALVYDASVRAVVVGWKERALRRLSAPAGAIVAEGVERPRADVLVAVPPDPDRALERSEHPALLLARELAEAWKLPVARLLDRPRAGRPQRGLPLAERRRNVAGAFVPVGRPPRRVALVDDVYTTGATVSAAASALRRAGAREVAVVTFARAIRGR